MSRWLHQLDDLLRGRKTSPQELADGRIDLPIGLFLPLAIVLGATYGFFMGWFALVGRTTAGVSQLVATMVKIPALFLLTLIVTAPSLYVFSSLSGSRLGLKATLQLLIAAIVVNLAVAASLGPILGFFTFSTTSYAFMVVLNVALLGVSGVVALAFLLHALRRLVDAPHGAPGPLGQSPETKRLEPGAIEPLPASNRALGQSRAIFRVWVLIYGLVGAQMGWLLRPFIGSPDMPFSWYRDREGNFFQAVLAQLQRLFDG